MWTSLTLHFLNLILWSEHLKCCTKKKDLRNQTLQHSLYLWERMYFCLGLVSNTSHGRNILCLYPFYLRIYNFWLDEHSGSVVLCMVGPWSAAMTLQLRTSKRLTFLRPVYPSPLSLPADCLYSEIWQEQNTCWLRVDRAARLKHFQMRTIVQTYGFCFAFCIS